MLYVQEKVVKLGGVYLGGQVTSVEIQEAGSVYVAQDEKGRFKKSQPVGYDNGKVMIDILLEATKSAHRDAEALQTIRAEQTKAFAYCQ